MNYHRQFIEGFAHKSALLWKMTSENGKFDPEIVKTQWDILKKAFKNAISLSKPDFDKNFILMTDASDFGIGYIELFSEKQCFCAFLYYFDFYAR